MYKEIRNVAVIAHVDHGKTTLISNLLKECGIDGAVVDHNDLEKERGITILSKCTSFIRNGIKYNLIDTPGHADFGGEVERILSMVDGVILLVDSSEGPMPQTKFVLSKAIAMGLPIILMINKIDRADQRASDVLDECQMLFINLNANDLQLDFPVLWGSGRDGWASNDISQRKNDFKDMFDVIDRHVPKPFINTEIENFTMSAVILDSDKYFGKLIIGKIFSGQIKIGDTLKSINLDGNLVENIKIMKLFGFSGVSRIPIESASAGDIICIAGVTKTTVANTICSLSHSTPLMSKDIDPPTMSVMISVNDSPLGGREGSKVTSRIILERLQKEAETNIAIKISISEGGENFILHCRGELQLSVLVETMRREGFELSVGKPTVAFKTIDGELMEPIEEVVIDVDEEYSGVVIEKLSIRKGELIEMGMSGHAKARLIFKAPTRGLIGYQGEFRNDTRGTGVMNHLFSGYEPFKGKIQGRRNGVMVSLTTGDVVGYALFNLEERGTFFVSPRDKVYEGMIIGECNKEGDMDVNPLKAKQLTNMRASGTDENIKLSPPRIFSLEECFSYIGDDELVEITPQNIRLRKKILDSNRRKKK